MPVLKQIDSHRDTAAECPYPAWDVVVDAVGLQQKCDAQDRRAERETQLWRALADEPSTDMGRPAARR